MPRHRLASGLRRLRALRWQAARTMRRVQRAHRRGQRPVGVPVARCVRPSRRSPFGDKPISCGSCWVSRYGTDVTRVPGAMRRSVREPKSRAVPANSGPNTIVGTTAWHLAGPGVGSSTSSTVTVPACATTARAVTDLSTRRSLRCRVRVGARRVMLLAAPSVGGVGSVVEERKTRWP